MSRISIRIRISIKMDFLIILAALHVFICTVSAGNATTILPMMTPNPTTNNNTITNLSESTPVQVSGTTENDQSVTSATDQTDPLLNESTPTPTTVRKNPLPISTFDAPIPRPTSELTDSIDMDVVSSDMDKGQDNQTVNPTSDSQTPITISTTTAAMPDSSTTGNGSGVQAKIPIYLSAYFTLGGGWDGSGILPACEMALEHINEREDILPGYELRMVWNDTQCEAGLGTRVFFDQLFSKPQKIMILGPACSTATQAVAETAYYWNLVTMSYAAASSALSNRKKFPFFYRTYMPDAMYNPARIRLMREFGWTRVATIHENHELFSLAIDNLLTLLKVANITTITSEIFSEDPKNQIANLKSQDAKIIISNMYENKARRVFCEAYKQGLTGPDYVWMIIGWYRNKWWLDKDTNIQCSVNEMKRAVEGVQYFATESLQLSTSQEPTVAGISPLKYQSLLEERMNSLAPYGYDAAWAIALALNKSADVLSTKRFADGSTKRLEDFTYDDREMAELFFDLLNETVFTGVSGPVGFKHGDRVGITQVEQLQVCRGTADAPGDAEGYCTGPPDSGATLALFDKNELEFLINIWMNNSESLPNRWLLKLEGESNNSSDQDQNDQCVTVDFQNGGEWQRTPCSARLPFICRMDAEFFEYQVALYNAADDYLEWRRDIVWPGDGPPPDRTPVIKQVIVRQYHGIPPILFYSVCGVSACCMVISVCFLVFNVKYRQQRHVKMSSPNLNNLIILGGILVYLFVIISGIDANIVSEDIFEILCYVKTWALSVGFVLAFGALFSKTWRVHRVAAFKTPKRRTVTDGQLFIMVFVLLFIDVIILSLWQLIDPVKMVTFDLYPHDDPDIPNGIIQPYIRYCTCDTLTYWLGALYGYKGLLLIFGTFLAWETRKVSIPGLNDSKLIGISVYNVVILCLIGVAVSAVISSNPEARFMFVACIILFCTSITLTVVFVPKMIVVRKYPDGNPTQSGIKTRTNISENSSQGASLVTENKQLKDRIHELEEELGELQNKASSSSIPGDGKGCGFWSCGLVCGFSPSRGKAYKSDSGSQEPQPADITENDSVSAVTARV